MTVPSPQRPVLRMVETFTNQDVCRDAHLQLTYAATAAAR